MTKIKLNMKSFKIAIGLIILISSPILSQDTITIYPDKDAALLYTLNPSYNYYQSTNYGSYSYFRTIEWTIGGYQLKLKSLMGIDLSALPNDAYITEANLYLYGTGNHVNNIIMGSSSYKSNESYLRRIVTSWKEDSVTWNTCPDITDLNEEILSNSTTSDQDYIVDVTDLMRDMLIYPENNFGLMLSLVTEEKYTEMRFASSDYTNSSMHPKLEIIYEKNDSVYDFESFNISNNKWLNTGDDDIDWSINSGSTSSSGTGPSSASEGTYYAYIEASSPNYPNKTANLISPAYFLNGLSYASISFDYHMYGAAMGSLKLQISNNGGNSWTDIWSKAGNQGNEWHSAEINLNNYAGDVILLQFHGITGSNYTSDIAVDNIVMEGTINKTTSFDESQNYILSKTSTSEEGLSGHLIQNMQYFDGLGRLNQEVNIGGSPHGNDMIKPVVYDDYGRIEREYLPYSASDGEFGSFRDYDESSDDVIGSQKTFFQNHLNIGSSDPYAYSRTVYENSPLNRITKQGAQGDSWQPIEEISGSGDHVQFFEYGSNEYQEVMCYTVDMSTNELENSPMYYTEDELLKSSFEDENQNLSEEFKDKEGRLILKRNYEGNNILSTYYVYDDFGLLRYVIPPKALGDEEIPSSSVLNELCYYYEYDGRKRMIKKKLPGADTVFMIYDTRDRLVLTQDGELKNDDKWIFTSYDALNRPNVTGIWTNGSFSPPDSSMDYQDFQITWDSNDHDYDISSFLSGSTILSKTYYDDYEVMSANGFSGLGFDHSNNIDIYSDNDGISNGYYDHVKGQITGTANVILDGTYSDWVYTVNYYDNKYRIIQQGQKLYPSGTSMISTKYDFVGKILENLEIQNVNASENRSFTKYKYDHAGRLLRTSLKINDEDQIVLSQNEYNELGELSSKNLNLEDDGTFTQDIDYSYNIRGWLTELNDLDDMTSEGDFFGMKFFYDQYDSNIDNDEQFNGNISATSWMREGSSNVDAYKFSYDEINRLKSSDYKIKSGSTWMDSSKYETGYSYDLNGNLQSLFRRNSDEEFIDLLNYEYTGNQLTSVDEEIDAYSESLENVSGSEVDKKRISPFSKSTYYVKSQYLINYSELTNSGITQGMYINSISFYVENANDRQYDLQIKMIQAQNNYLPQSPSTTVYDNIYTVSNEGWNEITLESSFYLGISGNLFIEITKESGSSFFEDIICESTSYQSVYSYEYGTTLYYSQRPIIKIGTTTAVTAYIPEVPIDLDISDGFIEGNESTTDYYYDDNGNMIQDLNKGIDITYNHLNLPNIISTVSPSDNEEISYLYDAAGIKWVKKQTSGSSLNKTLYAGNFVYRDNDGDAVDDYNLDYILNEEGKVNINGSSLEYQYYLKDHLGNTRVVFDENILQEIDYYPFGMISSFGDYGANNKYLYNGKELQDELLGSVNLDWYDYGARFYDPTLGRWNAIDNKAEKYPSTSLYTYALNNPILFLDPDGNDVKVSTTEDKNTGRTVVTYDVTVRIENRTLLNNATVYKHALAVKNQIEESFSSYDKNTNTEYRTKVTFDKNEKNYVMAFTSEVTKKEGNVIYRSLADGHTKKIGDVKDNLMQVRLGAKSIENQETTESEIESGRTGAHEYGHSLGLLHPAGDRSGNSDAVESVDSSPENLMRQARYFDGDPGTEITIKQLEKAKNIVEEQQNH